MIQNNKTNVEYNTQRANPADINRLNQAYAQIVGEQLKTLIKDEAEFRLHELGGVRLHNFLEFFRYKGRVVKFELAKHKKILAGVGITCLLGFLLFAIAVIAIPQTISFAVTNRQSCVFSPALFPSSFNYSSGEFEITRPTVFSISGIAVLSAKLCAEPNSGFTASSSYNNRQTLELFKNSLFSKSISVNTKEFTSVIAASYDKDASRPIAPLTLFTFELAEQDEVFDYGLAANDNIAVCDKQGRALSCSLLPLNLSYEQTYDIALLRLFNKQQIDTVWSSRIATISAVAIVNSSIANQTVVYDSPNQITFETNKPLIDLQDVGLEYSEDNVAKPFPVEASFKDKIVTIELGEPLIRQKAYNLRIGTVVASDNSLFESPYTLSFTTSGGPQVSETNVGSSGVGLYNNLVVYFDQTLDAAQSLADVVSLKVNGASASAAVSISGNSIAINPDSGFPLCARVNISLTNDIKSNYGFSGNSAWSYDFRTTCHTNFSIGTSVQGRAIIASQFGTAGKTILFVGAMHGSETNSKTLLEKWINELDASPDRIPTNVSLVIVPSTNPDGVASGSRLNANGVNLNRNFPTSDWSSMVTEPDSNGILVATGGPAPLSEPETAALASYIQSHNIRFAITYHSYGGMVQSNIAGDAEAVGKSYAYNADYWFIPYYSLGSVFDYSISGAFEDWVGEKLGVPGLLVELSSSWDDEFWRNKDAMWEIVGL